MGVRLSHEKEECKQRGQKILAHPEAGNRDTKDEPLDAPSSDKEGEHDANDEKELHDKTTLPLPIYEAS